MGDEIEGFRVVAACLKNLGVTHMFGVVGIPVVEVGLRSHLCHVGFYSIAIWENIKLRE